jgi:hypothetical protein
MTLRSIPTVDDFTSAVMVDAYDDMVNPPGLTNFLAVVQVDHDVTAVRALNVPPVSTGDTLTAQTFVNGRLARSHGGRTRCRWRPDRVERDTEVDGYRIGTVTVVPPGEPAVLVRIRTTNTTAVRREVTVGLGIASAVTRSDRPWIGDIDEPPTHPFSPSAANTLYRQGSRCYGRPANGSACSVQGVAADDRWTVGGGADLIEATIELDPAESADLYYCYTIVSGELTDDGGKARADSVFERVTGDADAVVAAAEQSWNTSLSAMFTPGNPEFSGHLPTLHTTNEALRTMYWWGALGVLYFRRDNPASVIGRTYDTLMPRHWQTTTFIWDYSLSSLVHALLDPQVMRRQITQWIGLDIHSHFGTEWLTGAPVGYWYSSNDYGMTRLVYDYLRHTGDVAFLAETPPGADGARHTVNEHVQSWARAWHRIRGDSGLADYGDIDNLLECVSTYTHEVASLNAANVWCMRRAADIATLDPDPEAAVRAGDLRSEADALAKLVLGRYIQGAGYFFTGMPDGTLVPTRHCYDFATVGTTITADVPASVAREMVDFFDRELRTDSWMHALSPSDPNAAYSLRPDHQWNGAYPAWPADSARATIALGRPDVVADWITGLARSTRQGPPGQAHFVELAAAPVDGGARKAPPQAPYLVDWACSAAGAWCELVIGGVFGVDVGLDGSITVNGVLDHFDPDALLENLTVQGVTYRVDRSGAGVSGRR